MKLKRFSLYVIVGAAGTGVQYIILLALIFSTLAGPVFASSIGAIAGAFVNYCLNYQFTFNSTDQHAAAAPKFISVAAAGLAVNWLTMTTFVHAVHLHYLLAQVISSGIVLLLTFSVNSVWFFNTKTK
jgi:putative flippase GtrA